MATQDSPRYLRASTYLGVVPLAGNAGFFLLWCLFRSDFFVFAWIIGSLVGLAAVLTGTTCLIVAIAREMFLKHRSWPMSGNRTLVTVVALLVYLPASLMTVSVHAQLSRRPSVDTLDAASRKHYSLEEVKEFLDKDPASVNMRNEHGETPLHHAAMHSRERLAELLISRGADVTLKTTDYGETALHYAAVDDSAPMVVALIAARADPNAKDRDGGMPMHNAAQMARVEAVKALLDQGADVNATNAEGKTPLDLAIEQQRAQSRPPATFVEEWNECVRLLRANGGVSGGLRPQ